MTIRLTLIFLAVAFTLLPLVLPARQLAIGESANISAEQVSPEAAAVLELVKNLDKE